MSYASDALKEFHESYEIPNDKKQEDLRIYLIEEEFKEVSYELCKRNLNRKDLAKELADLLYVVYGTAYVFNINLDIALQEVHRSNMSKLGDDGLPIRRADGKILKGPNYFEPEMDAALKDLNG